MKEQTTFIDHNPLKQQQQCVVAYCALHDIIINMYVIHDDGVCKVDLNWLGNKMNFSSSAPKKALEVLT